MTSQDKLAKQHKYLILIKGVITNIAVSTPAIIGLIIIAQSRGPLTPTRICLAFFIAGFTGLIILVRKNSPISIGSVRGRLAVIEGAVFMSICWGIAIYIGFFGLG